MRDDSDMMRERSRWVNYLTLVTELHRAVSERVNTLDRQLAGKTIRACSFCGRDHTLTGKLVSGATASICPVCLLTCTEMFEADASSPTSPES